MAPRNKIYIHFLPKKFIYTKTKKREKIKMYSLAPTTDELSTFLIYYIGYLLPPIWYADNRIDN